jgi:probable F420-dependent oxidoreductase
VLVDGGLGGPLPGIGVLARDLETAGYSGGWTIEGAHDPFLPHVLAAEHTTSLELGTAIAVAFARSPMTLAHTAWDLQALSGGRFVLGLGSQIKPHITKRFSMPWSHPAARMRELILAIGAIWDAWLTGAPLQFRGEFYTHTLMTPFFSPNRGDVEAVGAPRIFLAGVGPAMTEVAGEVADGFICHPFTTERYLREITLPALERGREKAGKSFDGFEISGPSFVVTGATDEQRTAAGQAVRQQLAFYGSTPAYRPVLDLHGWGDLQTDLNRLSKAGDWKAMGGLIDDDMLATFAIVADPEDVAGGLAARYGDVVTRVTLALPHATDPDRWSAVIAAIKNARR